MYIDKKFRVFIVPIREINSRGENVFQVYSSSHVANTRLPLDQFKYDTSENAKQTLERMKTKGVKPMFAAKVENGNFMQLVQDDRLTKRDTQKRYEDYSVGMDSNQKLAWVLNNMSEASNDQIYEAAKHMNSDELKLAITILKHDAGIKLDEKTLSKYHDPHSLRAVLHNVRENVDYEISLKPRARDFQLSRAYAARLAALVQALYKTNPPTENKIIMDEKHVKTYVDKILKNREKLLSDVNIGGLNINEMLANDAHRSGNAEMHILGKVLYNTILDPQKQKDFVTGDDREIKIPKKRQNTLTLLSETRLVKYIPR